MRSVFVVVAIAAAGCSSGESSSKESKPVVTEQPTSAPAPKPKWKPPPGGVDVTKILWRTSTEVERALGPGTRLEDGKVKYAPSELAVTYERGSAVAVDAPGLRVAWASLDEETQFIVYDWFGVPKEPQAGKEIVIGGAFVDGAYTSEYLAAYDQAYASRLRERVERELEARNRREAEEDAARRALEARERAAKLLRGRVHLQQLSEAMADRGLSDGFRVVRDADDEVLWVTGLCTRALLDDMAQRMGPSFSSYGFRRMWCGGMEAPLR